MGGQEPARFVTDHQLGLISILASVRQVLETGCEPWEGSVPSVGSFTVAADGRLAVTSDNPADEPLLTTLAEPLQWWRKGYWLLDQAVMCSPSGHAVYVNAEVHLWREHLLLAMIQRGWQLLGDQLVPLEFADGQMMIHSRRSLPAFSVSATVTMRMAEAIADLPRPGGDAAELAVTRGQGPVALVGRVFIERFDTLGPEPNELARVRHARSSLVLPEPSDKSTTEFCALVTALAALPILDIKDPTPRAAETGSKDESLAEPWQQAALEIEGWLAQL